MRHIEVQTYFLPEGLKEKKDSSPWNGFGELRWVPIFSRRICRAHCLSTTLVHLDCCVCVFT
jgi:hypothetical protein